MQHTVLFFDHFLSFGLFFSFLFSIQLCVLLYCVLLCFTLLFHCIKYSLSRFVFSLFFCSFLLFLEEIIVEEKNVVNLFYFPSKNWSNAICEMLWFSTMTMGSKCRDNENCNRNGKCTIAEIHGKQKNYWLRHLATTKNIEIIQNERLFYKYKIFFFCFHLFLSTLSRLNHWGVCLCVLLSKVFENFLLFSHNFFTVTAYAKSIFLSFFLSSSECQHLPNSVIFLFYF